MNKKSGISKPAEFLNTAVRNGARIMAITPMNSLESLLARCEINGLVTISFDLLTATTLSKICPDVVLAPLMAPGFDIVDVGQRLEAIGFKDQLLAVSEILPNPVAVVREVSSHFKFIDFGVFEFTSEADASP